MYAEERQHAIAGLVAERGRVSVTAVAEQVRATHVFFCTWLRQDTEDLNIEVNGQLYEESSYEGTDFEYSWYVGDQPCNSPLSVQVVAVAGSLRGESEPLAVQTGAC